jgi:hypothetical protein
MYGESMSLAVESLKLFLFSLPAGCYFNVFSFGSDYETVFPESVPYRDETLMKTIQEISQFDADLGGTEILTPL